MGQPDGDPDMKILMQAGLLLLLSLLPAWAQETGPVQSILQENRTLIEKSSRKTIQPAIDALASSGLPQAQAVLEAWQGKNMWQVKETGLFYHATDAGSDGYSLTDFDSGETIGRFDKSDLSQSKPNSGVRSLLATALVAFQLNDADPAKRADAVASLQRDPGAQHLTPLRGSIANETDPGLKQQKRRLERLFTAAYDTETSVRVVAINSFHGDLGVDVRATLNPLVVTKLELAEGNTPPADKNVANILKPGSESLPRLVAYDMLVSAGKVAPRVDRDTIRNTLSRNIVDGRVGGVPLAQLDNENARIRAYTALSDAGTVPPFIADDDIDNALDAHVFFDAFVESDRAVTQAAQKTLRAIDTRVGVMQALDLTLDALSLASIYFLAAIGLAITFGVMGVINMAHGEFIMMGAYTGYVVQQFIPNHTASILVAIPLAFAVTFAAGVAMERLVIRWLYNRPLETLLATFGISIALQQLAKNIFGTQARPLTAPGWLDGAWVMNDVVSISYIRIAIFVLGLLFLGVFLFIMKKTRLGLETRAVTQNPRMAASMGINPGRVNMLTFGLGSGIAGIAGVAIGLFAKVTSELGSDYIVQSFMTVVVGGVGNIWGTLAGATMIGFLQKGIEWFNPSNTLAAQTYMIVFIIIFIQFRPRGIIALKGRAAGD